MADAPVVGRADHAALSAFQGGPKATMNSRSPSAADLIEQNALDQPGDLRRLFHQLNNQLGIVLAHAELIERKATDEPSRARATQVVSSVLDALGTAKAIRLQMGNSSTF